MPIYIRFLSYRDAPTNADRQPSMPKPPTLQKLSILLDISKKFHERNVFNIPKCNIEFSDILPAVFFAIHIF